MNRRLLTVLTLVVTANGPAFSHEAMRYKLPAGPAPPVLELTLTESGTRRLLPARVRGSLREAAQMLDAFERFALTAANPAFRAEILSALADARAKLHKSTD